jgi:hypothetical protein
VVEPDPPPQTKPHRNPSTNSTNGQ